MKAYCIGIKYSFITIFILYNVIASTLKFCNNHGYFKTLTQSQIHFLFLLKQVNLTIGLYKPIHNNNDNTNNTD